jgi:hypothetical protein
MYVRVKVSMQCCGSALVSLRILILRHKIFLSGKKLAIPTSLIRLHYDHGYTDSRYLVWCKTLWYRQVHIYPKDVFSFFINADPNLNPNPLIQKAKPCRSGSWSNFKFTKVELLNVKYLLILVKFNAPGSDSAFPIRIRFRGQPNQCGSQNRQQFRTYRKVLRQSTQKKRFSWRPPMIQFN